MTRLSTLPAIMLAPNGARRTRADHPALPMTIAETVAAAQAGFGAGAGALHAHVRDESGAHVLDAGLYRELIAEMALAVPGMPVQITTEAVGRYRPQDQRALVRAVRPEAVSVCLAEMWPGKGPDAEARAFYQWAAAEGIAVQHICFTPEEVMRLAALAGQGEIPAPVQLLCVLGRYRPPTPARPAMLPGFLDAMTRFATRPDWAVCAFGPAETDCLLAAARAGGKARVGFENNLIGPDGRPARDNAARVRDLVQQLAGLRA